MFSVMWQEDYVAWVCDQDAYACSGQKCSAQSMLFIHEVSLSNFKPSVYSPAEIVIHMCGSNIVVSHQLMC